ncbi:hypothetical protein CLU79DRAFT_831187 [Phycomyces nitens]|nr:hypothetical protein CLU79DRAFT_831187 [Phycomyces nitens]
MTPMDFFTDERKLCSQTKLFKLFQQLEQDSNANKQRTSEETELPLDITEYRQYQVDILQVLDIVYKAFNTTWTVARAATALYELNYLQTSQEFSTQKNGLTIQKSQPISPSVIIHVDASNSGLDIKYPNDINNRILDIPRASEINQRK